MKKKLFLTFLLFISVFLVLISVNVLADTYEDFDYECYGYDTVVIYNYDGNESVVTVPETIDGKKVVALEGTFTYNEKIEKVILPANITTIRYRAFYNCINLKEVILPSELTLMDYATFYGCSKLEKINIPDKITSLYSSTFAGCGLTEISIPASVNSIASNCFVNCKKLKKITLHPENQNFVVDEFGVLYDKEKTTIIQYPCGSDNLEYTIPKSVISIYTALQGCSNLSQINVDPDNEYYSSCDGVLYNKDKTELFFYPSAKPDLTFEVSDSVNTICSHAFQGCKNLEKIVLPDSVLNIFTAAFINCFSLKEIVLPDSLESLGDAAFAGCSSLNEIILPDSLTVLGYSAFSDCYSLHKVVLPSGITTIDECTFYNCNSLEEVVIPDGVKSIGVSAFENCTALTGVVIPESVNLIEDRAFYNCSSLMELTLPVKVQEIYGRAFYNCKSLTKLVLKEGLKSIGASAFDGCENLKILSLPKSLISIRMGAFDSSGLKRVYYSGTEDEFNNISGLDPTLSNFDNEEILNAEIYYNTKPVKAVYVDLNKNIYKGTAFKIQPICNPGNIDVPEFFTYTCDNDCVEIDKFGNGFAKKAGTVTVTITPEIGDCSTTFTIKVIQDRVPGDLNGDGVVNVKDVTLLRRYNAGGYNIELK